MITAGQLRPARALIAIDQRELAELSGLSVPTVQRMEASDGGIRGNVGSLMNLIRALDAAGIELINDPYIWISLIRRSDRHHTFARGRLRVVSDIRLSPSF